MGSAVACRSSSKVMPCGFLESTSISLWVACSVEKLSSVKCV